VKILARNQRARFDYEILEEVEAGIILSGQEVKSVRGGHVDLRGAYVSFALGKPFLRQAKIQPYRYASALQAYDPAQDRELLLHRAQIEHFLQKVQERGLTVLPLEIRAGRRIKVLLGLARGRKKYDKRERIREREALRRLRKGEEM
jgi:SsrA-binding protein